MFAALGGTASAAVIVSSNSQVGPNVIAGSKAAAGTTNNVIAKSLGANDLADASVTKAKLAGGSVDSGKIQDGHVLAQDLGPGAVTSAKLAPGAVTLAKLGDDVQRSFNWSGTLSDTQGYWQLGGMIISSFCGPGNGLAIYAGSGTLGVGTSTYSSYSRTPLGGGPVTPVLEQGTYPGAGAPAVVGGSGARANERGQGTIVIRLDNGETGVATFRYLADGTHCELSGQWFRAAA